MSEGLTFIEESYFERGKKVIQLFNGSGMIGSIAGSFLVEQLQMEYRGYFTSPMLPPFTVVQLKMIRQ